MLPLGRHHVLGRDRVDGAGLHARVAIDALVARVTLDVGGTQEQLEAIQRGELDAAVLGADGQPVVRFTSPSVGAAALQNSMGDRPPTPG
jgi:hypothetical protein